MERTFPFSTRFEPVLWPIHIWLPEYIREERQADCLPSANTSCHFLCGSRAQEQAHFSIKIRHFLNCFAVLQRRGRMTHDNARLLTESTRTCLTLRIVRKGTRRCEIMLTTQVARCLSSLVHPKKRTCCYVNKQTHHSVPSVRTRTLELYAASVVALIIYAFRTI
jgi:hypothetical protein